MHIFLNSRKQTKKKAFLAGSWAYLGLKKHSEIFNSKRRDSGSSTDIDRQNQRRIMKSERGALVRDSDPPSGHSVRKTTGDRWRAPARRLTQTPFGRCCVENRRQKLSIPLRWHKIGLFSALGEERRTPRAPYPPVDHGYA